MFTPNTDLLPPLFDRVLDHFNVKEAGYLVREEIVKGLELGIITAAAQCSRAQANRPVQQTSSRSHAPTTHTGGVQIGSPTQLTPSRGFLVELKTSDRLSGADMSRAALVQQLQTHTGLDPALIEIALLLVEAQIDLRLKGSRSFKIAGIEFSRSEETDASTIADWFQTLLAPSLKGAAEERPSVWSVLRKWRSAGVRVLIETIQLSATVREAASYEIRVDRHLVEPLIAPPRSDERIRMLHISDLHLVASLNEPGRKLARPALAATHSFEALRMAATAVESLQPRYDMLVATGDLTTDGARASFETVLQYLQSGSITGANPMRIATYGLNAARSQRILIPGNHDRYAGEVIAGQRLDFTCEEVLETPKEYPYLVGYRPLGRDADSLTLLFLVFDSNLQAGRRGTLNPKAWIGALAKGEIGEAELVKARQLMASHVKSKEVERIGGGMIKFDPAKCIRIALLHHHPVTKYRKPVATAVNAQGPFKLGGFWSSLGRRLVDPIEERRAEATAENMAMENSAGFLRCCFECGVQLVLFGHQHYPYRRLVTAKLAGPIPTPFGPSCGHLRAFCCPTTLQYDAPANGFYVFDFESETCAEWSMYGAPRGDGQPMQPMKQMERWSYQLNEPPSDEERAEAHEFEWEDDLPPRAEAMQKSGRLDPQRLLIGRPWLDA